MGIILTIMGIILTRIKFLMDNPKVGIPIAVVLICLILLGIAKARMYDPQDNYLKSSSPVLSWAWIRGWLFTVDHKRIAILYFIVVMSAFALGGTHAILVRLELWHPNGIDPATGEMVKGIHGLLFYEGSTAAELMNTSGSEAYNRAFTMHGAVMVFLFIIPSTPAILGNF